jgi:chemotaxis protein CheX
MAPSATKPNDDSQVNMPIETADVDQMVEDLFSIMLGMPAVQTPPSADGPGEDALQATVRISGQWNAEVKVVASMTLIERIASAMFSIELNDLEEEEKVDALGEAVNVIGGNVKGVLNGDCNLSLPCVGKPFDNECPNRLIASYDCEREPLIIELSVWDGQQT